MGQESVIADLGKTAWEDVQKKTPDKLNNEVLHFANQGVTVNEIHNLYHPPKSLQNQWAAHNYHGSEEHNSRAVVNRYLGYWDANPATLILLKTITGNNLETPQTSRCFFPVRLF